jgi:hypothetical protein
MREIEFIQNARQFRDHRCQRPHFGNKDSNDAYVTKRLRPILTVVTRRALINDHIVVLPTPTSLQAVFTETARGLMPSRASSEMVALDSLIASQQQPAEC